MRPLALHLRNFRAHATLDVELTAPGAYSIVGPNGSGKSSILTAIDFALFGGRGEAAEHVNDQGDGSMSVEFEFEHGGDRWRVRRQVTNRKSTVDLERLAQELPDGSPDGLVWESLTRETAKETGDEIERVLGLSRATLRASSLLMQGDAGAFCHADPRERKRILGEVLGLDRYARLADAVRADRGAADSEAQRLEGRAEALGDPEDLEAQAATLTAAANEARSTMERAAGELEQAETDAAAAAERFEALREQTTRRREAEADHRAAQERARALRAVDVDAQVAREKADRVRTDLARLDTLVGEHETLTAKIAALEEQERAHTDAVRERDRLLAEHGGLVDAERRHETTLAQLDDKIAGIQADPAAVCDRCEQHLPDGAKATALASLRCERDAASGALADARDQAAAAQRALADHTIPAPVEGLDELRARSRELAGVAEQRAAARATLAGYQDTIAKADSPDHRDALTEAERTERQLAGQLDELEPVPPGADAAAQEAALTAQARAARLREEGTKAQIRLREIGGQLEQTLERLADLKSIAGEQTALGIRRARLALLERAYGPNGIPLLILENAAIPAIEHEANAVLAQLEGKPASEGWRVELRTQAETKAGGLRDALDVIVHVPNGTRRYEALSGGESTRVAIAVRLGIARLLAHRRGADCQLLALDEPDALDDAGKAALIDLIAQRAGDYELVVLISHDADLRDRFDHSISLDAPVEREPVDALA